MGAVCRVPGGPRRTAWVEGGRLEGLRSWGFEGIVICRLAAWVSSGKRMRGRRDGSNMVWLFSWEEEHCWFFVDMVRI